MLKPEQVVQLYLLIRASRCLAFDYLAEMGSPETINRVRFGGALDWAATPRPESPEGSAASNSLDAIPVNDDEFLEESDDLDME